MTTDQDPSSDFVGQQDTDTPDDQHSSSYPFKEKDDPTTYRNFHERFVTYPGQFYPQVGMQCFPKNDDFALSELAKHDLDLGQIFEGLQEQHKTFGEAYFNLSKGINEGIAEISNSQEMTRVINRTDKQYVHDVTKQLKDQYEQALTELKQIQEDELKHFKALFLDQYGKFRSTEVTIDDQSINISSKDAKKFYQKAKYQLQVAHINQQAVLTQRYNHCLKNVKKSWENPSLLRSVSTMASITAEQMPNATQDEKIEEAKYHLPIAQQERMDCQPYSLNQYQTSFQESLNARGEFYQSLDHNALKRFGFSSVNRYQSISLLISFSQTKSSDGKGKISAKCHLDNDWSSGDKLAALKAFITACHAQGLKSFNGLNHLNIHHRDKIKLIEHIRGLYGTQAIINDERYILDRNIVKQHGLSKATQDHCFGLLNNPGVLNPNGQTTTYIHSFQERRGSLYCTQEDALTDPEFELLKVPDASSVKRPEWAPKPRASRDLTSTPLTRKQSPADPRSHHAASSSSSSSSHYNNLLDSDSDDDYYEPRHPHQ